MTQSREDSPPPHMPVKHFVNAMIMARKLLFSSVDWLLKPRPLGTEKEASPIKGHVFPL